MNLHQRLLIEWARAKLSEPITGPFEDPFADEETEVSQPAKPLYIYFRPRFWGSREAAHELGHCHLLTAIPRGGLHRDQSLCGRGVYSGDYETDVSRYTPERGTAGICKKCMATARKQGYVL